MATRLDRLSARRIDPEITSAKHLNEVYTRIHQSDSVRYVIGAMQSIDPEYTQNTYAQGERVWNQLDSKLETKCEFKCQGSVTNDTHIRARSDIDVLSIVRHYHALEPPQVPSNPYQGDPIKDLLSLRSQIVGILIAAFPKQQSMTPVANQLSLREALYVARLMLYQPIGSTRISTRRTITRSIEG